MIQRIFKLKENRTDIRTEILAGVTTFMTMSYIIFVQPAVLNKAGMDFGAVMVATCLSAAIGTFLMGIVANYPIAIAPAMGHNFFFTFTVVLAMGIPWEIALGAVFISGFIFFFLSLVGLRERILEAIPESLKHSIAVGIGLLIAFIGLEWAGIVVDNPGTLVGLGELKNPPVLLALSGLIITSCLMVLRIKGAIFWGLITTTLIGLWTGLVEYQGILSKPPSLSPILFKLDIIGCLKLGLFTVIFVFFLLDLFDTIGTLIGVSEQAGFMVNGKLPRARQALLSDSLAIMIGGILGTSTVTCYIESATGVAEGGRTGLANIITGILFLLSLFIFPLVKMIGGGYNGLYPIIAPALIIVGSIMLSNVRYIPWDDYTESIPSFITLIIMPTTFSITEGISFGFISYSFLKLISGRGREVHLIVYLFSILFILRYMI